MTISQSRKARAPGATLPLRPDRARALPPPASRDVGYQSGRCDSTRASVAVCPIRRHRTIASVQVPKLINAADIAAATARDTVTDVGLAPGALGAPEDRVVADPAPADPECSVDLDPFERGTSVRALGTPGHLEDARCAFDIADPQRSRPRGRWISGVPLAGGHERRERSIESSALRGRQPPSVGAARVGDLELQRSASSAANRSVSPECPSTTVVRPAAMSASASRSIACHRSVQNQA